MKRALSALCLALLLSSCAGARIARTHVASGASNPTAIYIRPFDVTHARIAGHHSDPDERIIRGSLAPADLATNLKEEVEKIAPTMILTQDDPNPHSGWLVEGEFEQVHAGSPFLRVFAPLSAGRSEVIFHVRITDLDHTAGNASAAEGAVGKDADMGEVNIGAKPGIRTARGTVIYDFTVAAGSNGEGPIGTITAPGPGYATPFDYKNAAERIMMALSVDPHRYGSRSSTTIR